MIPITSQWFECKVRCERTQEDASVKNVTELYTVDALSFTEAEARITDYLSGVKVEILAITKANYNEVILSDSLMADRYFKVKIKFISIDDRTGKEKKTPHIYLVQAESFKQASAEIAEFLKNSLSDYEKNTITETNIIELIQHEQA